MKSSFAVATQIGKVGGDKLMVKTVGGEFSSPLTELHDAWWNSISRDGVTPQRILE